MKNERATERKGGKERAAERKDNEREEQHEREKRAEGIAKVSGVINGDVWLQAVQPPCFRVALRGLTAGPRSHPTRQPVRENSLLAEPTVSVRSLMPGMSASRRWTCPAKRQSSYTFCRQKGDRNGSGEVAGAFALVLSCFLQSHLCSLLHSVSTTLFFYILVLARFCSPCTTVLFSLYLSPPHTHTRLCSLVTFRVTTLT